MKQIVVLWDTNRRSIAYDCFVSICLVWLIFEIKK